MSGGDKVAVVKWRWHSGGGRTMLGDVRAAVIAVMGSSFGGGSGGGSASSEGVDSVPPSGGKDCIYL